MTTKMTMTADNVFCLAAYRTGHLSPPEIEIPLRRYDEASQAQRRRAGILMSKSIYSAEGRHSIPLILDQIEALEQRFGENTPRGGILFKSPFIFDIQGVLCLDSYGRGNVHNCQYDPWRTILDRHAYWNRPFPMPADITKIWRILYTALETNQKSEYRDFLKSGKPVRLGWRTDSFMYLDKKYKITQEILRLLNFYNVPYEIETHSDLVAHDDYIDMLSREYCTSIIFPFLPNVSLEEEQQLAPGAPCSKRRRLAMEKLRSVGHIARSREIILNKDGLDTHILKTLRR